MCIYQREILNNSKYVDIHNPWRLKNTIKCGECVECLMEKQNEWILRTQSMYEETIKNGGFVIFDTLTYSEKNVPWTKSVIYNKFGYIIPKNLNFRCFCLEDIQKFFKRLRKQVEPKSIRYYLAAEYGTTEGKTHRPHYHIMIYYTGNGTPEEISHKINECWQLGFTDGIDRKGSLYFYENCLFDSLSQSNMIAQKYVQKYLCKESEYQKRIKSKVYRIAYELCQFDKKFLNTYYGRLAILDIRRNLNQFRKISKGYGLEFLEKINPEKYIDEQYIIVDDFNKVKRKIKLPNYYIRKLYKQYDKDVKCWFDNELGILYKKEQIKNIYRTQVDRHLTLLQEIKNYDISRYNEIKNILSLRSVKDYVEYLTIKRNVVYNTQNYCGSVDDFSNRIGNERRYARNFTSRRDIATMERPYLLLPYKVYDDSFHYTTYDNYFSSVPMNEQLSEKYIGFERIYILLKEYVEKCGRKKQKVSDIKNRMQQLFGNNR